MTPRAANSKQPSPLRLALAFTKGLSGLPLHLHTNTGKECGFQSASDQDPHPLPAIECCANVSPAPGGVSSAARGAACSQIGRQLARQTGKSAASRAAFTGLNSSRVAPRLCTCDRMLHEKSHQLVVDFLRASTRHGSGQQPHRASPLHLKTVLCVD